MKPSALLHGRLRTGLTQTQSEFAPLAFEHILLGQERFFGTRQHFCVLFHKSCGHIVIYSGGIRQKHLFFFIDIYTQERPYISWIFGRQDRLEKSVVGGFLALVFEADVAADEECQGYHASGYHYRHSAEMHKTHHNAGSYKGHARGDKPSADYGDYARDSEHCTFAPPGSVGKRCAHGHHEGDKSRGERQLH